MKKVIYVIVYLVCAFSLEMAVRYYVMDNTWLNLALIGVIVFIGQKLYKRKFGKQFPR